MPRNAPDNPPNRPGLMNFSGIYAPENGHCGCIFMQNQGYFCINIQPCVKVFRHFRHRLFPTIHYNSMKNMKNLFRFYSF